MSLSAFNYIILLRVLQRLFFPSFFHSEISVPFHHPVFTPSLFLSFNLVTLSSPLVHDYVTLSPRFCPSLPWVSPSLLSHLPAIFFIPLYLSTRLFSLCLSLPVLPVSLCGCPLLSPPLFLILPRFPHPSLSTLIEYEFIQTIIFRTLSLVIKQTNKTEKKTFEMNESFYRRPTILFLG